MRRGSARALRRPNRSDAPDERAEALHAALVGQRAAARRKVAQNIAGFVLPAAKSTAALPEADLSDSEDDALDDSTLTGLPSKPSHPGARPKSRPTILPSRPTILKESLDGLMEALESEETSLQRAVDDIEPEIASTKRAMETCVARRNLIADLSQVFARPRVRSNTIRAYSRGHSQGCPRHSSVVT